MEYGDEDDEAASEVGGPVRGDRARPWARPGTPLLLGACRAGPTPAIWGVNELGGEHPGVAHLPSGVFLRPEDTPACSVRGVLLRGGWQRRAAKARVLACTSRQA